MTDREKVIKGLECCLDNDGCYTCDKCPYAATDEERKHVDWNCHEADLQKDALELLKEHETEYVYNGYNVPICKECGISPFHGFVPSLGRIQSWGFKYCPGCGRKVAWDDDRQGD